MFFLQLRLNPSIHIHLHLHHQHFGSQCTKIGSFFFWSIFSSLSPSFLSSYSPPFLFHFFFSSIFNFFNIFILFSFFFSSLIISFPPFPYLTTFFSISFSFASSSTTSLSSLSPSLRFQTKFLYVNVSSDPNKFYLNLFSSSHFFFLFFTFPSYNSFVLS